MKIALISDIHSNLCYLETILALIRQEKVDEIYSLGDSVGYYDSPHEVIQTCMANNIKMVRGNHENYMLGLLSYEKENEDFYRIAEQKKSLTPEDINFLENLPDAIEITIKQKRFYFAHSFPGNCIDYIRDIRDLNREFLSRYDYFCFGHTHRPLISVHFGCCVLNPGSIGQPRDYSRKPSYIVIDMDHDNIKLVRADLGYQQYIKNLRERGYGEATLNVLERSST